MKFLFLTLGLLTFKAAKPSKEPYYVKMKGFRVVAFNTQKVELACTAVFFNTYNAKAKLEEVVIDVFLEGKPLGRVIQPEIVSIPKNSAFDVPLLIRVEPPGQAVKNALWQGGRFLTGKSVKIQYKGYIKLKAIGFIPIKVPMEDEMEYNISEIF
jgi:hypothetical protein